MHILHFAVSTMSNKVKKYNQDVQLLILLFWNVLNMFFKPKVHLLFHFNFTSKCAIMFRYLRLTEKNFHARYDNFWCMVFPESIVIHLYAFVWCCDAHKCLFKYIFKILECKVFGLPSYSVICIKGGNISYIHGADQRWVLLFRKSEKSASQTAQAQPRVIWEVLKKKQRVGVKASVLFPFAVQTVYSTHFVHTNLHCCTIRLCNEGGKKSTK